MAAKVRRDAGVPAWRYLYAGEFPNNSLGPCCPDSRGAWHGSEIALIFGTTEVKGQGSDTPNEKTLAFAMRNAWTNFAKDPAHGLEKLGWPSYDPSSKLYFEAIAVPPSLILHLNLEPSVIVL